MKVFLYTPLLLLFGCGGTRFVHSVDTTSKPTFSTGDSIYLSLDYFQHHDWKEESPDDWSGNDDTSYLFKRFASDFDSAARTHFPMNRISVSQERGCLPWDNLVRTMQPLDTLQLQMCFKQQALSAKKSVFVHFAFFRGSNSAGSSRYGPMSATQFANYTLYVAGLADNGAFYFRSFRNHGPTFNNTKFSVKREHKMINLIVSELQKLYVEGDVKHEN